MTRYLLTREVPEGLNEDTEIVAVFTTNELARRYADTYERQAATSGGWEYEPLIWDWNPADGVEDPGFGSDGGSGLGWRIRMVGSFG